MPASFDAAQGSSGDWTAAGDAVLDLPSRGTTFVQANRARATAIRASLQAPPIPDPCA